MKIWLTFIYSFVLTMLIAFGLVTMKAISAPQGSSDITRQTLNPQNQYLLIDKTQTNNNTSRNANTNIYCTDAKGVYIGTSQNSSGTSETYYNCHNVKTSSKSSWGETYYWPECSDQQPHINYRYIDEVGSVCAPATLRWKDSASP
jgi:hypothetical protein